MYELTNITKKQNYSPLIDCQLYHLEHLVDISIHCIGPPSIFQDFCLSAEALAVLLFEAIFLPTVRAPRGG
jgi:hypothetical protein